MGIEIKAWLYDILNAINEIDSFFVDTPKDFLTYQGDIRTRRAVERNIEIIGEAMNRILQKDNSIELPNSRKIVDARNHTWLQLSFRPYNLNYSYFSLACIKIRG